MQKRLENQKGSISLFILLSSLFFLIVVTNVGINARNKEVKIDSEIAKIKSTYEKDVGNEEQMYHEIMKNREKPTHIITFDANGGTVSEETRVVAEESKIGELPIPIKNNLDFGGWFTEENEEITANTLMGNTDITYYARWMIKVASEESTIDTLSEAIAIVPKDNKPTEIQLYDNVVDNIVIEANQNIILNMQGNTLESNSTGSVNLVNNGGRLEIINGTLISNAQWGTLENARNAEIIIKDSTITSTGSKNQAIVNNGGTITIEGNSHISANAYTIHNRSRNNIY